MKLKTLPILLILLLAVSAFAQGPTNNVRPTGDVAVMVDTNGNLLAPTNLFAANSNRLNLSIGPGSGSQPASANLTNWSQILTNILLNFQAASANLTNLSALSTNVLAQTNDTRVLKLTNSANTFGGNGAALTSLTAANLTGSLPAISGAALTSLTAANLSGTVAIANGGTGKTTLTNAAQAIAVFPMSPAGGNNGDSDYANATPGFEGQIGLGWYGNHRYELYASGSTTIADWLHQFNFPTGMAYIGSSNHMDVDLSNPQMQVHLNGSAAGWGNTGDAGLLVYNWSTNAAQSGGSVGVVVMGPGVGGPATVIDIVGLGLNQIPSNRSNYLQLGMAMIVFNYHSPDQKGFSICSPSAPGYTTGTNAVDHGNYSFLVADYANHATRIPIWHPNFAFQPNDTGWNDLFFADPLNANVKVNGGFYVGGSQWNSSGASSNLLNLALADPTTSLKVTKIYPNFYTTAAAPLLDAGNNGSGIYFLQGDTLLHFATYGLDAGHVDTVGNWVFNKGIKSTNTYVGSGLSLACVLKTSAYTLTTNDYTVAVSNSSTTIITLPVASGITNYFNIKNLTAGTVIVTNGNGTDLIDGKRANTNSTQYLNLRIQSDGIGNWYTL